MLKTSKICDWIKKQDKAIKFVNVLPIHDFVTESRVTAKGKYKVKLEFDAEKILYNPKSIPLKASDYRYQPRLLFIEMDWKTVKKEKNICSNCQEADGNYLCDIDFCPCHCHKESLDNLDEKGSR